MKIRTFFCLEFSILTIISGIANASDVADVSTDTAERIAPAYPSHIVKNVELTNSQIVEIPKFIYELSGLNKLTIEATNIAAAEFSGLSNQLIDLDVKNNFQLTRINNVSVGNGGTVSISQNTSLVNIIGFKIQNAEKIDISGNLALSSITGCKFSSVDEIVISGNPMLENIYCGNSWDGVRKINLSGNALDNSAISGLPDFATSLNELILSYNIGITSIDGDLGLATSPVSRLDISNTGIKTVPKAIPYMLSLDTLIMSSTCISEEEYKLFYSIFEDKISLISPKPEAYARGTHCN